MIEQRGKEDGCDKIIYTKPSNWVDKATQAYNQKCGAWNLQAKLQSEGKCGHPYGKYNCYVPHDGAVSKTCIEWDDSAKTIAYTIGYQGKAGKPTGTKGRDTYLNRPTSSAGGIPQFGSATIQGGEAGPLNRHGSDKGGRPGGGHTGYSKEYSAYPRYHTQDGQVGWLGFAVKYINVGQGGSAGLTKAGYFKNVEGPIVITVGAAGKGGANGAVGTAGGQTVVKARSGGFNIFYDIPTGSESPTGGSGNNSNAGTDIGPGDGTLFVSNGGAGGIHRKQYETCSVSGSTELFDAESNKYSGGQGYPSEFDGYGHGGNGNGGTVPGCPPSSGHDGQGGGVIIFY